MQLWPSRQACAAPKARQPLASAMQVRIWPPEHWVSLAAEQVLLQATHAPAAQYWPAVQAAPALKARQPSASAAQACSRGPEQRVAPAAQASAHGRFELPLH